eukprot:6268850-Amphidinium_carterae.1
MQRSLGESPMPAAVERTFIDAEKACARGLGPSQSAAGIPLGELSRLPLEEAPLVPGGPCFTVRCMVAGTWWLT